MAVSVDDDAVDAGRRHVLRTLALAPVALGLNACGGGGGGSGSSAPPPGPAATRTWSMGFFPTPARPTVDSVLQGIDRLSTRADLILIHEELPWRDLLNGMSPDAILDRDKVLLVARIRSKGLRLGFMADLTDGLSRGEEPPQLRQLGRSIVEPEVQQAYRDYVAAFVSKLQPDFVGLAAETNLTRAVAPVSLYAAVVAAANAAASDLVAAQVMAPLVISVQVETAWGKLGGNGPYQGIDTDFQDFPFAQRLGLSAYPYFGYAQPEDMPADYFSRLLVGRNIPAMVMEGGWPSVGVGTLISSPDVQRRYIVRLGQLLDSVRAVAVIQTEFADLDLSSFPPPLPANLPLFSTLGLTDSDLNDKPALAAWDALFARTLV